MSPTLSTPSPPADQAISQTAHTPPEQKPASWLGTLAAAGGAIISVLYLLNPGWGVFELLPDNLPIIGNLDEVFFTLLLLWCLQTLGIRLPPALAAVLGRGRLPADRARAP